MPHRDRAGACGTRRFHGAGLPQRWGRRVPLLEVLRTAIGQSVTPCEEVQATAFRCSGRRQPPGTAPHGVPAHRRGRGAREPDPGTVEVMRKKPCAACYDTRKNSTLADRPFGRAAHGRSRSSGHGSPAARPAIRRCRPPLVVVIARVRGAEREQRDERTGCRPKGLCPMIGAVFHVSGVYRE